MSRRPRTPSPRDSPAARRVRSRAGEAEARISRAAMAFTLGSDGDRAATRLGRPTGSGPGCRLGPGRCWKQGCHRPTCRPCCSIWPGPGPRGSMPPGDPTLARTTVSSGRRRLDPRRAWPAWSPESGSCCPPSSPGSSSPRCPARHLCGGRTGRPEPDRDAPSGPARWSAIPTNVLALEAARRRRSTAEPVHLAACHRVLRAQQFPPGYRRPLLAVRADLQRPGPRLVANRARLLGAAPAGLAVDGRRSAGRRLVPRSASRPTATAALADRIADRAADRYVRQLHRGRRARSTGSATTRRCAIKITARRPDGRAGDRRRRLHRLDRSAGGRCQGALPDLLRLDRASC